MAVRVEPAPAGFQAWPALLALLQQAFAYLDGRIHPPSSLQGMAADDLRAKAQREQLFVAWHGSTLVGCAFADVREACVYVGKVAVAPAHRGQGVARALLDAAAHLARARGRPVLELQTRVELVENHRCFAALGFAEVARTTHPGCTRPTSVTMQRRVPLP